MSCAERGIQPTMFIAIFELRVNHYRVWQGTTGKCTGQESESELRGREMATLSANLICALNMFVNTQMLVRD